MEDVLDEVANGHKDSTTELAQFYFGGGDIEGLKNLVTDLGEIDARELATFDHLGEGIAVRVDAIAPTSRTPTPTAPTCPTIFRRTS